MEVNFMDMGMLSLIGILLALVLLVWGSFKGMPIMILGPACAAIVFFKDSYFYGIHIIRFFDTLFLFKNNVLYFILIYYITQSTGCQFAAWCFFITLHKFPSFSTVSRQIGICAPDSLVFAHKYAL